MAYLFKINVFEGPLDLLLHLIEKNQNRHLRYSNRRDHRSVYGISAFHGAGRLGNNERIHGHGGHTSGYQM